MSAAAVNHVNTMTGGMAERVMRRYEQAVAQRASWLGLWRQLGAYVRPAVETHRPESGSGAAPDIGRFNALFDGTALSANMVLAGGCMSRLTPAQSPWFSFDPPAHLQHSDAARRWYAKCSEIAQAALATSNFYTEIHECYLDRGAFGTCCLFAEQGQGHPLRFEYAQAGSFAIAENAMGLVDTVFRELELTARQAEQRFGREALPERLRQCLDCGRGEEKSWFIHAVYPRGDAERDRVKLDGAHKPVASVYLHRDTRAVCGVGGFDEMPAFASRYLKWGGHVYGFSPAWEALADTRQVNELQKNMDVLAEVAAFPRILLPHTHEGEVDLRANGATYFKDPQSVPREWLTQGRYDVGKDRIMERQAAIRRAFHVELFQMFAGLTQKMTAFEVSQRVQEKIELFSPTFTRLTTELYTPVLSRIFALLLRGGVFPEPPDEAWERTWRGTAHVADPRIQYVTSLALALRDVHHGAFMGMLDIILPLAQARPELMDNLDLDRALRDMALNKGLPTEWLAPEEEVERLRETRAQAQQIQTQLEMAERGAGAAAKAAQAGLLPAGAAADSNPAGALGRAMP